VTKRTEPPPPRRADVADGYNRGAGTYEALWSPVILPFAAGTVDAVILAYVLFHLADPPLALAEAARVLRPGGRAGIIIWAWERESRAHPMGSDPRWRRRATGTGPPR
jgi:SAM-dependent methyltransferase